VWPIPRTAVLLTAVCPLLIIWVLPTAVSPLTMMVVLPLMGSLSIAVDAFVTTWVLSAAASLLFHFIL
jgi:hypothetical protein